MIEMNTTKNVCVVSNLVGQTTFLISVLDSRISFIAFDPKLVIDKTTRPIMNRNTTPRTLYKKAISTK